MGRRRGGGVRVAGELVVVVGGGGAGKLGHRVRWGGRWGVWASGVGVCG